MRLRASLVTLGLCVIPAVASAQPLPSDSKFTAVPCPVRAWTEQAPNVTPLPGAKLMTGRYEGGLYALEIPDDWNGELVLYAHGQRDLQGTNPNVLRIDTPTLREHWIRNGFAWAASSYRCNGTVYGIGLVDTMALQGLFAQFNQGRQPNRVYLVGQSLGGRVAVLGLREFPSVFAGGLAMCPVGPETWDFRVATAAAAEWISGIRPATATLSLDLGRMTQILGRSPSYTPKGAQLASIQIELTGGPRPFAMEGLASRFTDNIRTGLTSEPDVPLRAASNVTTTYRVADGLGLSSADLNLQVSRRTADSLFRDRSGPYREALPFDGDLSRPLLTIQGTGDLQVPVSQQQALKRAVIAAGKEHLLVQRLMRIPGHCLFSDAEQVQAFDDMVSWVRTGVRPAGDEVLGDLSNAGLSFTNPLRPGDPGTTGVSTAR